LSYFIHCLSYFIRCFSYFIHFLSCFIHCLKSECFELLSPFKLNALINLTQRWSSCFGRCTMCGEEGRLSYFWRIYRVHFLPSIDRGRFFQLESAVVLTRKKKNKVQTSLPKSAFCLLSPFFFESGITQDDKYTESRLLQTTCVKFSRKELCRSCAVLEKDACALVVLKEKLRCGVCGKEQWKGLRGASRTERKKFE
jgi:hypothetical protein